MLLLVIFTLLYGAVLIIDLIPMLKTGTNIKLWLYGALFAAAYVIQILFLLEIKLPNLNEMIYNISKHIKIS